MEKNIFKDFIEYIGGIEVWKELYKNNRLSKKIYKRENNYGSGINCNYKGLEKEDMIHDVMIYDSRKIKTDEDFYNINSGDNIFVAIRVDSKSKDEMFSCRVYNFSVDYISICRHCRPLFDGYFTTKFKYNLNKEKEDYYFEPLLDIKKYLR